MIGSLAWHASSKGQNQDLNSSEVQGYIKKRNECFINFDFQQCTVLFNFLIKEATTGCECENQERPVGAGFTIFLEAFHAPYLCATTPPMYREEGEISVAPFFLDHKNAPPLFGLGLCCCLYHHRSKHRTRSNICDGPQQNLIKVITSTQLSGCCKEQTHWMGTDGAPSTRWSLETRVRLRSKPRG